MEFYIYISGDHMARGIDFKQKEVISLSDGKILGFVVDVQAGEAGCIWDAASSVLPVKMSPCGHCILAFSAEGH